jgi:two-component system, OmpR family, response regulator
VTVSAQANGTDIGGPIRLDGGGLLHVGTAWVALPLVEWRLVATLLAHIGEVVLRNDLTEAAWPGKRVKQGTLSVSMRRVRNRIKPLGLLITTVRSRGFVLSATGTLATLGDISFPD